MTFAQACLLRGLGSGQGMRSRPLFAVPLAAALLLLSDSPAAAASGITSPGPEEVVTSETVVPLRATVDGPAAEPSELTLQAPAAERAEVVAVQSSPEGGELAYDFDTACAPRICAGRVPAANGTWTLRLSGGATDERRFVLRIPPAAPVGVAAVRSEAGVRVRWRQGEEPDLTGYAVEDAKGKVLLGDISVEQACDAERMCSADVPESAGAWGVRAFRSTCPGCRSLLASPASRAVGVGPAAPVGSAPPAPSASAGPSATPSRVPPQDDSFRRAFGGPVRFMPPPTAGATLPPPVVAPDGSFDPSLGYATPPPLAAGPPLSRPQDVADREATGNRLWLVMLSLAMVAASLWLRRWTRRASAD